MVSRSCWLVLYFISYRRNISHCFTYVYGKTRSEGGKGNKGKFSQRSIWFGGRDLFLFVSRSLFLSFSFCGNGDHRSLSLIINGFVGSFSQLAPKVSCLSLFIYNFEAYVSEIVMILLFCGIKVNNIDYRLFFLY